MSGIGSNSFKNSFESIKLSDPSKKEAFKAALVDAAKDGKIENKELQNIKTNFLSKELSSGDQKSLNVLLQNLSSEVTNAFPLGSKINPDNVEKASVFLNNLLSNDVNVTSTTTTSTTVPPNIDNPLPPDCEDIANRLENIIGTEGLKEILKKLSENDKLDPAKLKDGLKGINELLRKDSTIQERALGLQKILVVGGKGIGDVIGKYAKQAGFKIKIESNAGDEIKASILFNNKNNRDVDGDTEGIKSIYIDAKLNIKSGEFGFSAKVGKFSIEDEEVNSVASLGISFEDTSKPIESGSTNIVDHATQGTVASIKDEPELKDLVNYTTELDIIPDNVKDYLNEIGLKPGEIGHDTKAFFSVEVDLKGNVKARLILQREDLSSTKEKPSFKQCSIDLDVNVAKIIVDEAKGASKALINKYGPQIAANVVAKVGAKAAVSALNGISTAIPGIGQCAMAAQAGWEVGRLLGENVKIGDKTIDQHMQDMYKNAMLGPNADLAKAEGMFKSGITPLSNALSNALKDLPPDDPKRELLQNLYDVKITAMLAMGRPGSLTEVDCHNAKEKIELLQKLNFLTKDEANTLLKPIREANSNKSIHSNESFKSDYLAGFQTKVETELNTKLSNITYSNRLLDNPIESKIKYEGALVEFGREVMVKLRNNEISPEQAENLIKSIQDKANNAGIDANINNINMSIANIDKSLISSDNMTSNTLEAEIEFAKNINRTKERLNNGSKGNDSFITQALKEKNLDRALTLMATSNIEEKNFKGGGTTLTDAIKRNDIEGVKFLLENGADPNGNESLFVAIKENKPEMLKILLENGANIDGKNKDGKTVIDILDSKPSIGAGPIRAELRQEQENRKKLKEIIINNK